MVYAVVGSNYGDEGKGLAVDYLAALSCGAAEPRAGAELSPYANSGPHADVELSPRAGASPRAATGTKPGWTLVIRHNGGAQSGHTVEPWRAAGTDVMPGAPRRFVFHELSSGSFRHADTYWAETFLPDLYKLREELTAFRKAAGFAPRILASPRTCITTIDDVLLNMLFESLRGKKRHGSCGMGINEADLRGKAGFGVSLKEVKGGTHETLYQKLRENRQNYTLKRMEEGRTETSEYNSLLSDDTVLWNYALEVMRAAENVELEEGDFWRDYENLIFEGGQGLRLDAEYKAGLPHVTASRTGLTNVAALTRKWRVKIDEAIYVTRTYVTRHGAGPLPGEIPADAVPEVLPFFKPDQTNLANPWQGSLRYAPHDSVGELLRVIREDLKNAEPVPCVSLFVTHLDETGGCMLIGDRMIPLDEFLDEPEVRRVFQKIYR